MTDAAPQGQGQGTPAEVPSDGTQVQAQDSPQGFSQKDVNKIAGERAKQAKQTAINELLERAREVNPDIESIDDVLAGFSEFQVIQEAATSEAERNQAELEKAKSQLKAEREARISDKKTAAMRDALRDSGINPERLKSAMRLADLDTLEVDKEDNVSGLEDAVEAVREEAPEFFGDASQRQRVNAPQTNGTGVNTPGSQQTPEEMQAAWLGQFIGR